MKFTDFSLHESLQQGIAHAGYVECTPVQEQVLQNSLEGRDLYVQSQTGTGKTAAFLISIIQELLSRTDVAGKKALIMVPTRELAEQVKEEAEKLLTATKSLKCDSFYGGVGYDKQVASLKRGVDIMVGTPGRVIDLHEGGQMDLSSVSFLCIDEADRMFDMGFYPELRTLIKVLPQAEKRQTMLFSATLNSYVKNLAWEYTRNPAEITIAAENVTVEEIDQLLYHISSEDKMKLLLGILSREKPESLIIFCNTKRTCEVVSKRLQKNGIESQFIIGDLPQRTRQKIMDDFKAGNVQCLVATDVAARGIDVNDLAMVINYDLPQEAENYVHRIGRTARAGKTGKAFTFCSEQDVYNLPAIERYVGKTIPALVAEESLFVEDKSAGLYIHTENYRESYNDKSDFGKKRRAEYERNRGKSSGGNRGEGSKSNRGRGRYSDKNREASREYKRDRRVFNAEEEALLATMSTDERMKLYKERFGAGLHLFDENQGETQTKAAAEKKTTASNGTGSSIPAGSESKKTAKGQNAHTAHSSAQSGSRKNQHRKNKNGGYTRKNNDRKAQETQATKVAHTENAAQTQKKGLFGTLKRIFGGKK